MQSPISPLDGYHLFNVLSVCRSRRFDASQAECGYEDHHVRSERRLVRADNPDSYGCGGNAHLREAQVHIKRDAQVALIPVFQFGVFSDSDLSFFPGHAFDFNGRVFTNGNLFLAAQNGPLSFHSKMSTAGDVVRTVLVNNGDATPRTDLVLVPTATDGCDGGTQPPTATSSTCQNLD